MAVDTAAKRFSMMNSVVRSLHSLPSIIPDGTIATEDKQHLMDCYSGITFANPVAPTGRIMSSLVAGGGLASGGGIAGQGGGLVG